MREDTPFSGVNQAMASSPPRQSQGLLGVVWHFFAAPQTLMSLLGFLVLAIVLGTLLPQFPPDAAGDPDTWLAMQPGTLGQIGGLVRTLGLYDLFGSLGFRLLLALTGLTLFVWLVDSAALAWQATALHRKGHAAWSPAAFSHWGRNALRMRADSSGPLKDTESRARQCLSEQGFHCAPVASQALPNMVAGRRALTLWTWPVFYSAALAVLVGLTIGAVWGWRTQGWQLGPGESQPVAHGTPYVLRLDHFELRQDDDGRLLDYRSHITWLEDGVEVGQGAVLPGQPVTVEGLVVRQTGYAPVVQMRGQDSSGRPLALQLGDAEPSTAGDVAITFPTLSTQQLILVPDREKFVVLSFEPPSTEGRPTLRVELLDDTGAQRQPLVSLHKSGIVETSDMRLELELAYRPILRVERRPAFSLVVGGAALAVLALAVAWLASPQLLWIALGSYEEVGTRVYVLAMPSARSSHWPRRLTSYLQEAFDDGA